MQPWILVICIAFGYYGLIVILFSRFGQESLQETLSKQKYPEMAMHTTVILIATYLIYAHNAGGIHWPTAFGVISYLIIPSLMLRIASSSSGITIWDWFAILALWLPFDLHWVSRRPNAIKDALDWPLTAISAVIVGLVFWIGLKQIPGTKTSWNWSVKDFAITGFTFYCLALMLIPLGIHTGFAVPKDFFLKAEGIPQVVVSEAFTWKFVWYFTKILITIALSEEFLFRGVIQNFLDQTLTRPWQSLTLASILFGCAHLNNGAASIQITDWNWMYAGFASVAGLAYGITFRYTKSLIYPMLLHAMVDASWHTFFR